MSEPVPDPLDALRALALEPKRVEGDQGAVTNQDLRDLIALDKYERSIQGRKNMRTVLRNSLLKIRPPSARGH